MFGKTPNRRQWLATLAALGSVAPLGVAAQSDYPSRPIRIIVPFPAGGAGDTGVRLAAKPLGEALGQPIVVDNKPGGDGVIAALELIRSAPDGYSILFGTATPLIYTPIVRASKPPYDPVKDFAPVSLFSSFTYFMHVHESVPARNLQEFIAHVRKHPGTIAYGTGDATSVVTMAQIQMAAQLDMTHIPYKGGAPAFTDFAAGRIQVMVGPIDLDARMQGKSRPLAVLQARRSPVRPDVPSFPEIGYPQVNLVAWTGYFAPARTPAALVERLSSEMVKVFARPDLRETFLKLGFNLEGSTPETLGTLIRTQLPVWKEAVQFAKIPIE